MALNIRDPEVHELARRVAAVTGESLTDAVRTSLQERLKRVQVVDEAEKQRRIAAMEESARRFRALPVIDPRTPDEILGYDENGLPT